MFTIKFTQQQLDVLAVALGARPYNEVAGTIMAINQQLAMERQVATAPQTSEPKVNGAVAQ